MVDELAHWASQSWTSQRGSLLCSAKMRPAMETAHACWVYRLWTSQHGSLQPVMHRAGGPINSAMNEMWDVSQYFTTLFLVYLWLNNKVNNSWDLLLFDDLSFASGQPNEFVGFVIFSSSLPRENQKSPSNDL